MMMSEKKRALIEFRDKIANEIEAYNLQIQVMQENMNKSDVFDCDSSDSDSEFPLPVNQGPNEKQLWQQQSSLRTCLQATEELTGVQVLQSQVSMLTEAPIIEGEPPVAERGVWREVTAECRVDLVSFSISFYVHQPLRQFGAWWYRGVRTACTRAAHEAEVKHSILASVTRPSDAVEVLKNYAFSHRSRRTTLSSLVKKYPDFLQMEPMPDGGYLLKCANLLEVSWTLQNKWSPIAPFQHRMKFDLEYMDESYIKIITQAHRQLSDPTIETNERTMLLSKIIATCLEARGPTQELYESMSSDPETAQSLRNRRTTLVQEPEPPVVVKKKVKEVMAPPKSLPKKAKPKGKENTTENTKAKKPREESNSKTKKVKADGGIKDANEGVDNEYSVDQIVDREKSALINGKNGGKIISDSDTNKTDKKSSQVDEAALNQPNNVAKNVATVKKVKQKEISEPAAKTAKTKCLKDEKVANVKTNVKRDKNKKSVNNIPKDGVEKVTDVITSEKNVNKLVEENRPTTVMSTNENKDQVKNINSKDDALVKKSVKSIKNKVTKDKNIETGTKTISVSKVKAASTNTNKTDKNNMLTNKGNSVIPISVGYTSKKDENKPHASEDIYITAKSVKSKNSMKPVKEKINVIEETYKQTSDKNKDKNYKQSTVPKHAENNKNVANPKKILNSAEQIAKDGDANVANLKRKSNSVEQITKDGNANVANTKRPKLSKPEIPKNLKSNNPGKSTQNNLYKEPKDSNIKGQNRNVNKIDHSSRPKTTVSNIRSLKTGNIQTVFSKGNIFKQSTEKASKIPQKKQSPNSAATLKKNPLRISPRKMPSKLKTATTYGKTVQKTTIIPRLMKNASPRV